jgi:hypothetical protein
VVKFGKDPIYRTKVSVYWIFNTPGHMIALWKGKTPINFGAIRSKVKVTITINIIFDNGCFHITLILYIGSLPNLTTLLPCGRGRTVFILGSLGQRSKPVHLYMDGKNTSHYHQINQSCHQNQQYWYMHGKHTSC